MALVLMLSDCGGVPGENTGGQSDLTPCPNALSPSNQETTPSSDQEDETTQTPETPQGGGVAEKTTPYLTWDVQSEGEWPLDCTLETLQFAGFEDEELSDTNQQMRENTECEWQRYQDCAALSEEERFEQSASWGDIWAYPVSSQRYLNAVWVWRERMHFYTDELSCLKGMGQYDGAAVISEEEAADILSEIYEVQEYLSQGMQMMFDGSSEWLDEEYCVCINLGTDHEEDFVREAYYAVSYDTVYQLNSVTGA